MSKKKILVVDDEKDMVFAIELQLKAAGYHVFSAYDGQEALDITRKERPDCIILDLMLPKIEGHKVCRILKFDAKFKDIPVVILTAKGREKDQILAEEVGADVFLTKPYEPQLLMEKIRNLLERSKE